MRTLLLGMTLLGLGAVGSAHAATIIVPDDFTTIQGAISAASDGDTILVRASTYNERINTIGKRIELRSISGARITRINGGGGTVVGCTSGEGRDTLIKGFTFLGGTDSGMLCEGSSPTIDECLFIGNSTELSGGGLRCIRSAAPLVQNSGFDRNTANNGGGMSIEDGSTPTVNGCRFLGNTATTGGGAISVFGGAEPRILFSRFTYNDGGAAGGGIESSEDTDIVVTGSTFEYNSSVSGGGMMNAGRARISGSSFQRNDSVLGGGGMLNQTGSDVQVAGSSFCENTPNDITGDFDDSGGNSFDATCPDPCFADVDGNGKVDFSDLVEVLSVWGPCDGKCPADLDGNGLIDFFDVLVVLSEWGPCPGAFAAAEDTCGDCIVVSGGDCDRLNRYYVGNATECGCGACCLPDSTCVEVVSEGACTDLGGVYEGDGTTCGETDCP